MVLYPGTKIPRTAAAMLKRLWDPATGFFCDRDGATKEWSLVKSPTGFYPFWAGIGGKEHLPIFKHLFNPAEFWTPFPVPTISMDFPKRTDLRRIGWAYWNWSNWPMTTCHVVDATARAAKELDPSLVPGAAGLLRRSTKVHFIDGDLKRPCVSEYFDPITGQPNAPKLDYAHSYYIDLIMRHVVGIEANPLSDCHSSPSRPLSARPGCRPSLSWGRQSKTTKGILMKTLRPVRLLILPLVLVFLAVGCAHTGVKRVGMVTQLRSENLEEYKRLHADSNPGVRDLLTKYHMRNFSIYLQQIEGKWYEFGYYEYAGKDFEADMAKLAKEPRNIEWLKVCDPMQIPLPGAKGWTEMDRVYFNQ